MIRFWLIISLGFVSWYGLKRKKKKSLILHETLFKSLDESHSTSWAHKSSQSKYRCFLLCCNGWNGMYMYFYVKTPPLLLSVSVIYVGLSSFLLVQLDRLYLPSNNPVCLKLILVRVMVATEQTEQPLHPVLPCGFLSSFKCMWLLLKLPELCYSLIPCLSLCST